jgi:hypothetical protein
MASVNTTVKSTHKSTVLLFPAGSSTVTTRKKKQSHMSKVIAMPKRGVCPTCDEPANVDDGVLCPRCKTFLCQSSKCGCICYRIIRPAAEQLLREMLAHPKEYGL